MVLEDRKKVEIQATYYANNRSGSPDKNPIVNIKIINGPYRYCIDVNLKGDGSYMYGEYQTEYKNLVDVIRTRERFFEIRILITKFLLKILFKRKKVSVGLYD